VRKPLDVVEPKKTETKEGGGFVNAFSRTRGAVGNFAEM
jgi:hypothetical protein